jgi:predicted MFS family arabinose efflux permease
MGFFGIAAPFVTIVAVYVFTVFFTWMLRVRDHEREGYRGVRKVGLDLAEGVRFAWNASAVRGVLIISVAYFTFGTAFLQVFAPLFATRVLDIGESGFGLMISVMGIGSILGSLALATANPSKGRGKLMLGLLLAYGFLLILFSATSYSGSVALVFMAVVVLGAVQSGFIPLVNTVLVEAAPPGMRGRVLGLLSLDRAMMALGGVLAGVLAAALGPQVAQILFGIGCVVTATVFAAYPPLRRLQ